MKTNAILIVCDDAEVYWHTEMAAGLSALGSLTYTSEESAARNLDRPYALIIVDTENIDNMPGLVRSLRLANEKAKIVVLSSVPTWKAARSAFQAGADDFYRKRFDSQAMLEYLQNILNAPPKTTNRQTP